MFPSERLVLTLAGRLDSGMPWFKTTIVLFLFVEKLLEERQEDAAGLKFKCNRAGTMSDEETAELRNEIKVFRNIVYTYILRWITQNQVGLFVLQHFVGERRIDEDLGKTILFLRDEEKMLEVINVISFYSSPRKTGSRFYYQSH